MAEIGKTPNAQRNYAEKFVSFAAGRAPNSNDTCIVDKLATNMATPTYSHRRHDGRLHPSRLVPSPHPR